MPSQARRNKRHRCTVCLQQFTSARDARVHINRLHLHINAFKCRLCGKEGPDPSPIRRHCHNAHSVSSAEITVHYEEFNKSNEWKAYYQRVRDLPGQANSFLAFPVSTNSNIRSAVNSGVLTLDSSMSSAFGYITPTQMHTDMDYHSQLARQSRSNDIHPPNEELFQALCPHHWSPQECLMCHWHDEEMQVYSAPSIGVNLGMSDFDPLPTMAAAPPFPRLSSTKPQELVQDVHDDIVG